MIIIADDRIPEKAKSNLEMYGEVLYLSSKGITYPAISGHPDIFFCQGNNFLIAAPNSPDLVKSALTKKSVIFNEGNSEIGNKYPKTAYYNAVCSENHLIYNKEITDLSIKENAVNLNVISVNQAYTRCNLIALRHDRFITSDNGIEKKLLSLGLDVLFVNPKDIELPGFDHGFIGGCCGVVENKIFFIGSLDQFSEGKIIREFAIDYDLIELYEGPLFDGGSLIFIP